MKRMLVAPLSMLTFSLLLACNSQIVPYGGFNISKVQLQALDKPAASPGEVLQIKGKNFDAAHPEKYDVSLNLAQGETVPVLIKDMGQDSISIYAPILYTQTQDLSGHLQVALKDQQSSSSLPFTLKVPEYTQTQLAFIRQLRFQFMQGANYGELAETLREGMKQIRQEAESEDMANHQIDFALAVSGQSFREQMILVSLLARSSDSKNSLPSSNSGRSSGIPSGMNLSTFNLKTADDNLCPEDRMPAEDQDLVVFYVNGMLTEQKGYCNTKRIIREKVRDEVELKASIAGMYQESAKQWLADEKELIGNVDDFNANGCEALRKNIEYTKSQYVFPFVLDLIGASVEIECAATDVTLDLGKNAVELVAGAIDVHEAAWNRLKTSRDWGQDAKQVEELVSLLSEHLRKNKRVILIPHSQGNFFVAQALRNMLGKASNQGAFSDQTCNIPKRNALNPLTSSGSLLSKTNPPSETGYFTRNQILNSIGVIWVANPMRIEDPDDDRFPMLSCSTSQLAPTCHPFYVGVRQDPVSHLRWMEGGTILESIKALAPKIQEIRLNRYKTLKDYNEEMLYSPYKPDDVLGFIDVKNPESVGEKLDFSFYHHSMDCIFLDYRGEGGCSSPSPHPLAPKNNSATPWKKIKEALLTLAGKLVHPQRNNVNIVIE